MRLDRFWVVTDPTPVSEFEDICFETSLEGLRFQFMGGLSMTSNPTIFTGKIEAQFEAEERLKTRDLAKEV